MKYDGNDVALKRCDVDADLSGNRPGLAPVEIYRSWVGLGVVQSALFSDGLGQRQAPRVELELSLSPAGAKRDEGLRHVEQVDDIVGKYVDVVGRLVHERAERHACTMSLPFERDPRVVALRGWTACACDGIEDAFSRGTGREATGGAHIAEDA